ncbi:MULTISPECIES: hypothetical protein [Hymenobacter]|uniref:Uncharacterized protein n=2 Tax=Hymenobacter TaxID=89966 RepID=A0A7Y7U5J1_9BACT|nr:MULTISPECIES: hypothetical protein [Hymenobacter]NVO31513.1 hypothetical protein [Hymenobacter lapidiphilus]NVO83589.1 hypothetical protein [Hymenobacter terrestris]
MAKKPAKSKSKKEEPEKKARVHKELEGFEIKVNPLGEITSNYSIEEINQFLNRHVRDKKLVNRDGAFGEKDEEDDDLPIEEVEESEEDFVRRSSTEAKSKKPKADAKGKEVDEDEVTDDEDE